MDCSPWWVLVTIAAVTSVLHALFLAMLYIMLSRKIEHLRGGEAGGGPAAKPEQPPALVPAGGAAPREAYAGGSDTSSETSDDSDSGPTGRQVPLSEESVSYSTLRFAGRAADYENMRTGADYVNVDPKKKQVDFWACSSPVAAKSPEYTEVKL
ncbi:regulator of hemoglobinization and erythroid cell expansion protein [Rhea pennata]|uniref:regulator of hemoglobinization and erythroid cell expansion protein n=1 Tax=Rhea pennata TaxID=8795 RepID=UPI002E256099